MIGNPRYKICYHLEEESPGQQRETVLAYLEEGVNTRTFQYLDVLTARIKDTISLSVCPFAPVIIDSCELIFDYLCEAKDRVLFNGYQSWTDTVEMSPFARMNGLNNVPSRLIEGYALDGSGDYRFVEYTGRAGDLHGFTYMYLRRGDTCTLLGSLDDTDGFTLISASTQTSTLTCTKERPRKPLEAMEIHKLCSFAFVEAPVEQAFDRWFELMGVTPRTDRPLVGYTSWYRHYGDIDAGKLLSDLAWSSRFLSEVDCTGFDKLFQIDDGYVKVGDWLQLDLERFPDGMASMVADIVSLGFIPGLWLAPFVCERDSQLYQEHKDWLLLDGRGTPITTGSQWSGGFALNTQNPEVRAYVTEVLRTVTQDWGFKLLKLDFLYAACIMPHAGMNRGQLMTDAINLIREAVGDEVAILACGVPLASVFGKVEYCRIGCDVGLDWNDKPYMRLLHRERVSTKNSMSNTIFRSQLNRRAFINDPDVFFLRRDTNLSLPQRTLLLNTDANFGGMLLTSDNMESWDYMEKVAFKKALTTLRAGYAQ